MFFQQQQQRASGQVRGGLSNGQLTEDEALARALQASISDQQSGQEQQAQDQHEQEPEPAQHWRVVLDLLEQAFQEPPFSHGDGWTPMGSAYG